jgi:hypothetical protein
VLTIDGAWEKYAAAVAAYSVSKSDKQLDVGKWAHAYILVYVGNEADPNTRRTKRAQAVHRLDDELTEAGILHDADRSIRLYAVAQVFGTAEARKLGIGKLEAFLPCVFRDKETEAWGMRDSIDPVQETAVRELWARAVAGMIARADLRASVFKAMGKRSSKANNSVAARSKPTDGKPAVVSYSNITAAERAPEVAPENAIDCGRRMASLPYARPDSPDVWRTLGDHVRLTDEDALAFVEGLACSGKLSTLVVMIKAAAAAVARLQAESKSAESARVMAPVATKSAPIAVATGPGGLTGVTVVAGQAA